MTGDSTEFDDLARELRQQVGAEFRAEAEITELETEQGRRRRRTISDVATEAFQRGDLLTIRLQGWSLTGAVLAVGTDYLIIDDGSREIAIRLEGVAMQIHRSQEGGLSGRPGSETFKARLSEFEQSGERLMVVAPGLGMEIEGRIKVVATDHLVVADQDSEWILPLKATVLAIRPRPSGR
jgi:hypothetical protein